MSSQPSVPPPVDTMMFTALCIQFVICSCGFVLNVFLAFTIAKNRQLRPNSCGLLIIWLALFDAMVEFSQLSVPFVLPVFGILYYFKHFPSPIISGWTIPLLLCFFIESYGPCFNALAQWMMFAISLDRLFAIIWPIQYKNMAIDGKNKYVAAVILIPAIGKFVPYEWGFYAVAAANPEKQVYCIPTDFLQGPMQSLASNIAFAEAIGTVCVYLLIAALIKCKLSGYSHQSSFDQRVFRSLFLLMAMHACWLPANAFASLTGLQSSTFRLLFQLSKIGQAANLPVLYICSVEYRCAIRKELANLCGICNDVQPAGMAIGSRPPAALINSMMPHTSNIIDQGRDPNLDRNRNMVPRTNNFL